MSDLNGRKVVIARLHTSIHLEEAGNLTNPIDRVATKARNMVMTKVEGGLLLKGRSGINNREFEAFIPDGNIASLQFEVEPVKK